MSRALRPPHRLGWHIHPGEVIRDELRERKIKQVELARLTGHTPKHVCQVLRGHVALTAPFALAIEEATGMPAHVLMRMQADHTLWLAVQERRTHR